MAKTTAWRHGARTPGARTLSVAITLAAVCGSAAAFPDKVILRDGTEYVGEVLSDTDRMVEIKTTISNIETTLKIEKWRVREVVLDAVDAPDADTDTADLPVAGDRDDPRDDSATEYENLKREGYALVLEIPMEGTFGEDIYPKSIASALEWAVGSGVTDVVFRINSGGGEVWAANKIVEIMERHEDDLRYHGLIESAISASIWPMFECDTISMAPGSDFGGAVVYSQTSTGEVEVDKKMNSIMAAKLASSAESKGHNPAIVRAMMLSEAEVWKYRRAGTTMPWRLTDLKANATAPGMEYELVDSDQQIMTLTQREAADLGVAIALADGSLESVATSVNLGPWDDAGAFGAETAEEWNRKSDRLRDRIQTTATALLLEANRMNNAGTVGSVGLAVNVARRKMAELKRYLNEAEDLEMDDIIGSFDGLDLDLLEDQIERRGAEVRRVRNGP
ncbi:MAG: hypothetical protein ACF8Q5_02940 [Phycisphaerales bacterium JB040]